MKPLIRWVFEALVRLYYPTIVVDNARERSPGTPVLFVLNHPNGLIDPLVLRVALGEPVRFLGKSTLFKNPIFKVIMGAFGGIPVYRQQDDGGGTSRNEETFKLCREALARGEKLALFPEGTTHSEPELKPLKTGAARIALSAERAYAESEARALNITVLPVGLQYEAKSVFRSRVLVVLGKTIAVRGFYEQYCRDERAAVQALTDAERAGLDSVVLQADTRAMLEDVAEVASHTADGDLGDDLGAKLRRAHALIEGYKRLRERDGAMAEALVDKAQRYILSLKNLGVRDPWALELVRPRSAMVIARVLLLCAFAPIALLGALFSWLPYRLAGPIAKSYARDAEDILSTVKLLAGIALIGSAWTLEAVAIGLWAGWVAALAFAVIAPLSGFAALRFGERLSSLHDAWQLFRVRRGSADAVSALKNRRRALADEIAEAIKTTQSG